MAFSAQRELVAVELLPDRQVVLLGDPTQARALIDCMIGPRLDPTRCTSQLRSPP